MTSILSTSLGVALLVVLGAAQNNMCRPRTGSYELFTDVNENEAYLGKEIFHLDIPGNGTEVTLTADFNEYFAFNATTRNVWVNGTVDAEESTSEILSILCRDNVFGGSGRITIRVFIGDVNDNPPVFTSDVYTIQVGEMTEVNTRLQTNIKATDADAQNAANLLYYTILPGPYSDYFIIPSSIEPVIVLMKPLDFEVLPEFSITIMAMDMPLASSRPKLNATCVLEIIVEDEDDQYPVFNSSVYQAVISNTAAVNSVVNIRPTIAAYDPDRSFNVKVAYSFHDPKGQSGELLAIDPETAVVTLTNTPTSQEVYLLLQATQTDNPSRYGVALLAVQVQGPNVNAPAFPRDLVQVMRTEAFPVGEVIATAMASDPDPGSIVTYSLDEASKNMFSLDTNSGDITLRSGLRHQDKSEHVLTITATDGVLQSTGQVVIQVVPVNNKPPVILTSGAALNVSVPRRKGSVVADIDARDDDNAATVLTYQLLTHTDLFTVDNLGQIIVSASEADLAQDVYQVALMVQDDGQPRYTAATAVTINFPERTAPVAAAQMAESDSLLPYILGAVVAVLLIIVIILTAYICKRRSRDKEHLDRAKKQLPSQDAKALAFKQQGTLGKQARVNIEFGEDPSDGDTTVQENPLSSASKGGYYNFGQVSDTDTELDMNEIQVETSVTPYANVPNSNDDNNNDNIYNQSQMSEESEDYTSDKQAITSFFRNGSLSTYRDSSGSELSLNTSPTDSHDSKKNLVGGSSLARSRVPEEELSNGHAMSGSSDTANLDPDSSVVPASQKQELTVYF